MAYFDLRVPLGWLFVIVGALLLLAGFTVSPVSSDGNPLASNINVGWGAICLFFGVICLLAASSHARKRRMRAVTSGTGKAVE